MSGSLDALIHAPARLRLMAIVATVDDIEFAALRDHLGVSDSVLSKHLSALAEVKYVRVRKGTRGGRRTTWVNITAAGRGAFRSHVAALRALIDDLADLGVNAAGVARSGEEGRGERS